MRLTNRLPERDSPFISNEVNGEHATKGSDVVASYNFLRKKLLHPKEPEDFPAPVSDDDFFDMLMSSRTELKLAWPNPDLSCQAYRGLAGFIKTHLRGEQGQRQIVIEELAVHPMSQRKGLASFLVGHTTEEAFYSYYPNELVFDTKRYETPEWFLEKIREVGFNHESEDGSPAMWLPGQPVYIDRSREEAAIQQMPSQWNGHLIITDDLTDEIEIKVYQNKQPVVSLNRLQDTLAHDATYGEVDNYAYRLIGQRRGGFINRTSMHQAIIAALNS